MGVPKTEAGGPPFGPALDVVGVPVLTQNKNQFSVVSKTVEGVGVARRDLLTTSWRVSCISVWVVLSSYELSVLATTDVSVFRLYEPAAAPLEHPLRIQERKIGEQRRNRFFGSWNVNPIYVEHLSEGQLVDETQGCQLVDTGN